MCETIVAYGLTDLNPTPKKATLTNQHKPTQWSFESLASARLEEITKTHPFKAGTVNLGLRPEAVQIFFRVSETKTRPKIVSTFDRIFFVHGRNRTLQGGAHFRSNSAVVRMSLDWSGNGFESRVSITYHLYRQVTNYHGQSRVIDSPEQTWLIMTFLFHTRLIENMIDWEWCKASHKTIDGTSSYRVPNVLWAMVMSA